MSTAITLFLVYVLLISVSSVLYVYCVRSTFGFQCVMSQCLQFRFGSVVLETRSMATNL